MQSVRYPLVGGSYAAISPAAASQTCVNLYAERLEDAGEKAKGGALLTGTPGKVLFKDLTVIDALATPLRGLFQINGRIFVAAGALFFEIDSAGGLVGSKYAIAGGTAAEPVTMYSNGGAGQIMIQSQANVYVYDGFSVNLITLPQLTGHVLTDGQTVYWMSGDKFDPSMAGQSVSIDGVTRTVAVVNSPDVMTVTATCSKSITAATNAAAVEFTTSVNHGMSTGFGVTISGATLNWLPANATWTITVTAVNKFTIPLDSTTFGALTGTVLSDFYDTTYICSITGMLAVSGAVLDGYFIAARFASTRFNISPLLDGGNNGTWEWDGLDFGNKESTPGYLRSVLACNEQLYLFGVDGFEVWQNTGQGVGGFPFERINGATSNIGSVSRWGPIDLGGVVGFIGGHEGRPVAYILQGFTCRRVSTFAEEYAWAAGGLGANCISSMYMEEGHIFWEIDFRSGPTWTYDLSVGPSIFQGFWHQRSSWSGSAFTAYNRQYKVFAQNSIGTSNDWTAGGKHLTGGDGTGKIYQESISLYADVSADMKWQRTLPYRYSDGRRIFFGTQTLEYETGTVPSGAAPVMTREYSDDRGASFINQQTASLGVHADGTARVRWIIGGSSVNRLWRYSGVGQNKVALVCLDADEDAGAA